MTHLLFVSVLVLQNPSTWNEVQWSAHIASEIGGKTEYVCADGSRVDILTVEFAYEVEWAEKWKEAPGQAILYGVMTNRKPAILLLVKNSMDEKRFILRCAVVCAKTGIRFETRKVP